jgi:hypothetical protein
MTWSDIAPTASTRVCFEINPCSAEAISSWETLHQLGVFFGAIASCDLEDEDVAVNCLTAAKLLLDACPTDGAVDAARASVLPTAIKRTMPAKAEAIKSNIERALL